MRRWITSDTHFGHVALQAHCRRPPNADDLIIANWRRLVKPEDVVIHLGDVAFTHVNLPELMASLPGRKILVRGNHDRYSVTRYMASGFDFACDGLVISSCYLSHHPCLTIPIGCKINIHGHLHNNVPEGHRTYPHCRLFSLEYTNYEPHLLEKLLK